MLKKLLLIYCSFSTTLLLGMMQPNPVKEMLQACIAGDVPKARRLIDSGLDVNTVLQGGDPHWPGELVVSYRFDNSTFLHSAAKEGHTDLARLLIERGANIEARDNFAETALCYAMRAGSPVFDVLIDAGVNLDELVGGMRPLSMAALCLQPRMIEKLLKCKLDTPLQDKYGGNGLLALGFRLTDGSFYEKEGYSAYSYGETETRALEIIELLRKHGVMPYCKDVITPFHLFALSHNKSFLSNSTTPSTNANKRFLCSLIAPLTHAAKKKEARQRYFTLLWACKQIGLPNELANKIFSSLPLDCKYSGLEELIIPRKERGAFRAAFLDECWPLLPTLLSPDETKALHDILLTPSATSIMAFQLTTDPDIQKMLDPKTWNPTVEVEHA